MKLTRRAFAGFLSLLPFVGGKDAKAKIIQNNPENLPVVLVDSNGRPIGIENFEPLENIGQSIFVWVNEKDRLVYSRSWSEYNGTTFHCHWGKMRAKTVQSSYSVGPNAVTSICPIEESFIKDFKFCHGWSGFHTQGQTSGQ